MIRRLRDGIALPLLLCGAALCGKGQVKGTVRDAKTGEPLAKVAVVLEAPACKVVTGDRGEFDLGALGAGEYSIKVSTVGYRLLQVRFELAPEKPLELEIALSPDAFQRTDRVEVRAEPFDLERQTGATEFAIDGGEAEEPGRRAG